MDGEEVEMKKPCFVICIGASAGGQAPLEHIFTAIPEDCDLSFVVVMHLPPDGPNLLPDLIRRYTSMEVLTIEDDTPLLPDTIHVIPPGYELTVEKGRFQLTTSARRCEGPHHPIDRCLSSLARDCGANTIAVILSGFGMDGTEGCKRIRENGGLVLVEDPETAIHPAMPQHVIAAGAVDMILSPEDIPGKLSELARGHCRLSEHACITADIDETLDAIFTAVKEETGHDFSSYKRNTVLRRIERRMAVHEAGGLNKYRSLLENSPQEARALAREILIGVTRFFRDPEAFEIVRRNIIPRLFANRERNDPVRIWHACCATGEEAYSVAMLVREHLEKERLKTRVQIFATDLDEAAVARARSGAFSTDIGPDIGETRLETYFTRSMGHWQAAKDLREMILFAHHNIIKDPPFSRLDLLVCRNFLIYLNPDMQKRLLSLFHTVLKPGGYLFLGSSETIGPDTDLFMPLDKKWKIFQRQECCRRDHTLFPFTAPARTFHKRAAAASSVEVESPSPAAAAERFLVDRYAPPCVVVNDRYEVLHIAARTSPYLEIPVGAPSMDILKMAREELRPTLRAAIYKSFAEARQVVFKGVKMNGGEQETTLNLTVEPLPAHPAFGKLATVVLEPVTPPAAPSRGEGDELPDEGIAREVLIHQLEEQLRITHEQLQLTTKQLEASNEGFMASNEELMSINEEFQSANEELQSTNEELEASKEELQALNEELITVNAELQGKVEELNQLNGDMENLFVSSGVAAIFLDHELIIKRFSPVMAGILNLIPADIGRPFHHLSGAINRTDLREDIQVVLARLVPVEREIATVDGERHYLMRIRPYRTAEGQTDGVVVVLVDVTERNRAVKTLGEREEQLRLFIEHAPVALAMFDREMRYLNVSRRWLSDYNLGERPLRGLSHYEVFPEIGEAWKAAHRRGLAGEVLRAAADRFERADGSVQWVRWEIRPWTDAAGAIGGIVIFSEDITERKLAEEALRESEKRLARAQEIAHLGSWELDLKSNQLTWSDEVYRIFGIQPRKFGASYEAFLEAVHPDDRPAVHNAYQGSLREGRDSYEIEHRILRSSTGEIRWVREKCEHYRNESGRIIRSVGMIHDITERKTAEEQLRQAHDELDLRVRQRTAELREKDQILLQQNRQAAMGEMIGNIAHQWRQPLNALGLIVQSLPMLNKAGKLTPAHLESLEDKAMQIILHMSQTIDDFRNYFKPDKEKVRFHLSRPVSKTINLIEESFKNQKIAIELQTLDDPVISGYPNEFAQVLLNILINARDAFLERQTSDGKISIALGTEDAKAVVTISDNAGGISEAIMDKIFDPYFTTKGPDQGTGIGLFMSKTIIEKNMGGTLVALNTANGAEFRIEVNYESP